MSGRVPVYVAIERRAGIPQGTLARLLTDRTTFKSDENNRWFLLVDDVRAQREREVEEGIAEKG